MKDDKAKALLRRLLPDSFRARCRERVYALLNSLTLARAQAPDVLTDGVALCGLAGESSGMGQCCRSMAAALTASPLPFSLRPLHSGAGGQLDLAPYAAALTEERDMAVNLFCCNADCTGYFLRQRGAQVLKGRKNIALWAWELPEFPRRWQGAFRWYDEIWTISEFCRASIAAATDKPVRLIPLSVGPVPEKGLCRGDFGLPEGKLLFLSMYDARSIQARKNPRAAIDAYCRAFPPEGNTALVLKVSGGRQGAQEAAGLRASLRRGDIYIMEGELSAPRLYALMDLCDVFVSLHRSEGFGYPIAEAMALGKAVVVTGWSGNMDFCTPENACCVGYTLRALGADAVPPYEPHQRWAEPDMDDAVRFLRRLGEEEGFREALGRQARQDIRQRYSPDFCAKALMEALGKQED